jgi:hypothetical protein
MVLFCWISDKIRGLTEGLKAGYCKNRVSMFYELIAPNLEKVVNKHCITAKLTKMNTLHTKQFSTVKIT